MFRELSIPIKQSSNQHHAMYLWKAMCYRFLEKCNCAQEFTLCPSYC